MPVVTVLHSACQLLSLFQRMCHLGLGSWRLRRYHAAHGSGGRFMINSAEIR